VDSRATLLMHNRVRIPIVLDAQAQTSRVNVAVAPDQQRAKDRLSQEVQDAVEDGLRVGGDDVSALTKTPRDGVQDPQEGSQAAAHEEGALDIAAKKFRVQTGLPDELVDNVDEGKAAKGKVAPFIGGNHEGADKPGDD